MFFNIDFLSTSLLTYSIIFLAEMGDKSQIVCMALAAKHKSRPIMIGAAAAFGLLNLLAVIFGNSLSRFIDPDWMTTIALVLFIGFGLHTLFAEEDEDSHEDGKVNKVSKNMPLTTFLVIFLAEFADKTQLAVVTMSTTNNPVHIWIGATLALISTSMIGIYAGRKLLARINAQLLNKISGVFFVTIGLIMLLQ